MFSYFSPMVKTVRFCQRMGDGPTLFNLDKKRIQQSEKGIKIFCLSNNSNQKYRTCSVLWPRILHEFTEFLCASVSSIIKFVVIIIIQLLEL